jgi:hypothetical protein
MSSLLKKVGLASIFSMSLSLSAYADSLKAYIFVDSLDMRIGKSVENDGEYFKQTIEKISKAIDYKAEVKIFKGNEYTKENIMKILNNDAKSVGANDILIFYTSSHGTNVSGDFPDVLDSNHDLISVEKEIHPKVKGTNARLKMTIIDACNNISNIDPITRDLSSKSLSVLLKNNYKSLFVKSKGDLLITSSEKGKFSIAGPRYSVFTEQFISAINNMASLKDTIKVSWKNALEKASDFTYQESKIYENDFGDQLTSYRPVWINNIQEDSTATTQTLDVKVGLKTSAKRMSLSERVSSNTNDNYQIKVSIDGSKDVTSQISKVVYYFADPLDLAADGQNDNNTRKFTVENSSNNFEQTITSGGANIVWADVYFKNNNLQVIDPDSVNVD